MHSLLFCVFMSFTHVRKLKLLLENKMPEHIIVLYTYIYMLMIESDTFDVCTHILADHRREINEQHTEI